MQLSEMPLTQQTASEVSRLYLSSKLKVLTAYEDDKQLQGILESLQHDELYSLTADEKIKVLWESFHRLYVLKVLQCGAMVYSAALLLESVGKALTTSLGVEHEAQTQG